MDVLQGFSQCWWPGPTCHVAWAAWAAIGAWLAAFATFFAVLLPFTVARQKDRLRTELQLSDFIPEMRSVRHRLRSIRNVLAHYNPEDHKWMAVNFQIAALIPAIEPTKKLKDVIVSMRIFQAELARWNDFVRTLEDSEEWTWKLSSEIRQHFYTGTVRLEASLTRVEDAIAAAYPEMADAALYSRDH